MGTIGTKADEKCWEQQPWAQSGSPENFQGTHVQGTLRGHLCDSTAFLSVTVTVNSLPSPTEILLFKKIMKYDLDNVDNNVAVQPIQEILQIVTNLITPRALSSPTYLLNFEMAPFAHSIRRPRKPHRRTKHQADRMIRCRDMAIGNF